ncbi:DMT family transporter [Paremcibacter congregatus]|uniref:EamA domain-containing protein n=1 Tax=Paremcibacter congregatus TaxID=2043170 RepID=A0A2G4YUL5_9PROT|nr:DMT family transporter [Paremcibacter congregatus]PHZ86034.1 hypothetical protein CRD36_05015 [Paremcibacter congregatus]QDE27000.1 DMT family transporter [Paremcibacter congregatus]
MTSPAPDIPETNNFLGIGFILMSCVTMTLSALLIRHIGKDLGSFEVVLIRCSFTLIFTLVLNARLGGKLFHSPRPVLLTLRSIILAVIVLGNFYAIVHLPLVQVTALQFTKPLFIVALAALFLSENIRLPRTMATLCGFIGILVILRPGEAELHIAHLAVLSAALGMAVIAIITKKLTRDHLSCTMVFYGNLVIILICSLPAFMNWQMPSLLQWGLIAALGLSTYGGQTFMVQAYRHGDTTVVSPFEYVRIIFIAIAGFIVFGEIPDRWTLGGAAIIIGATLFIAYRESRKKRRAAAGL